MIAALARGPDWVVIAKPSGLASHRSKLYPDRITVASCARERFLRPIHLVHRLDRAVSGCMLAALTPEAATRLHEALALPSTRKSYLALVRGTMPPGERIEVHTPIHDGDTLKPAHSTVWVLASQTEPRASLVRVEPTTGRNHQVRRHLRDLHHPILGDSAHGDTRVNQQWRARDGLSRLALHCLSLQIHTDHDHIDVRCNLPADLIAVWSRQPLWAQACEALAILRRPAWIEPSQLAAQTQDSGSGVSRR